MLIFLERAFKFRNFKASCLGRSVIFAERSAYNGAIPNNEGPVVWEIGEQRTTFARRELYALVKSFVGIVLAIGVVFEKVEGKKFGEFTNREPDYAPEFMRVGVGRKKTVIAYHLEERKIEISTDD